MRKARWRKCLQCAVIDASCKDLEARHVGSVVPVLGESLSVEAFVADRALVHYVVKMDGHCQDPRCQ